MIDEPTGNQKAKTKGSSSKNVASSDEDTSPKRLKRKSSVEAPVECMDIVEEEPLVKNEQEKSGYIFAPQRLTLRVIEGKGIGYDTGYSTFEALFANSYDRNKIYMPMIDLRAHHLDNNEYAFNGGLVLRRFLGDEHCVLGGLNLYYDFREGIDKNFQQFGFGFEFLGENWVLNVNGGIPVGSDYKQSCCYRYPGGYAAEFRFKEEAFKNFYAELGGSIINKEYFSVYIGGGPYYLSNDIKKNIWGGIVHIRPQIQDYLAFEFTFSRDSYFDSIFQGEIILSLPLDKIFYKRNKRNPCCRDDAFVYQRVRRLEIIPLTTQSEWRTNY